MSEPKSVNCSRLADVMGISHDSVNLITLYYTDLQDRSLPVNYRVYDKAEHKSKSVFTRRKRS